MKFLCLFCLISFNVMAQEESVPDYALFSQQAEQPQTQEVDPEFQQQQQEEQARMKEEQELQKQQLQEQEQQAIDN